MVGNVIGSYLARAAGWYGGEAATRRWSRFLGGKSGIERAQRWFDRYGGRSVFIGRLLPVVRTFISLPAGPGPSPQTAASFGSARMSSPTRLPSASRASALRPSSETRTLTSASWAMAHKPTTPHLV